ncbi:MAG: DUF1343 domain-containing protein, partial [Maribacter sp.]|nr:DUF1343 domain-containing protein [Maribacter sp.]
MAFLSNLKSTVFLWVLVLSACGNTQKSSKYSGANELGNTVLEEKKSIIVGANRSGEYLGFLEGKKVGIVANQTSVIFKNHKDNTHLVDSLLSLKIDIKKVFAPEHGFRGKADAGEKVKDGLDTKTGLPLISLYGKNRKPSKEMLEGLDIVVFDIQDVGVRFYTYIATL